MKQDQRPLLHLQRLKFVLSWSNLVFVRNTLCPKRFFQSHKFRKAIIQLGQPLRERRREMRSFGYTETPVLERGVFERIPEGHRAGRIAEADGPVLVRDKAPADAGEFGDELALGDAWIVVA